MRKISDNTKEIFEVVDGKGNIIGKATRKECHQNKKLIHQAVNLFVFNKKGRILLQKRSQTKDLYPGWFTGSATGHLDLNESFKQAAAREAKEEIGIKLKQKDLKFIDKFLIKAEKESELVAVFLTNYYGLFKKSKEEIQKLVWLELDDLFEKIDKEEIRLTPCSKYILKHKKVRSIMKNYIDSKLGLRS